MTGKVTGNLEKAYQTLELWLQTYPRAGEATSSPRFVRGAFHPGQSDLKERSRVPKKKTRPIPTLSLLTSILRPAIFSSPLPRCREHPSASFRTQAGGPTFSVIRYNIAVLKGNKEQMDRAVLRPGQAWSGTRDGSRRGSCFGSFRPLAGRPAVIEPRRGSRAARAGT